MFFTRTAPTTARTAEELSRAYGYESHDHFSRSLPVGATVLDVAAGKSTLGLRTAEKRPDIRWWNIDVRRGLFNFAGRQQRRGPDNFQYLQANVFDMPFVDGSFDRIYSSFLLPHIAIDSVPEAERAVGNMARMLTPETGILSVCGFEGGKGYTSATAAEYAADPEAVASAVVESTSAGRTAEFITITNNFIRYLLQFHRLP